MSIAAFLHEIEARLKTGQATEHTYRSAVVGTRFGASATRSPAEHPASGRDALRRVRRPAAGGCVRRTFPLPHGAGNLCQP
jgi:D-alanine-D-alanine ligase-like ATP-grasp enzyme